MKVSEVPFEQLKLGDVCISNVGHLGEIIELIPVEKTFKKEDNEIRVQWLYTGNINKKSWDFHYNFTHVEYLGRLN